MIQRIRRRLFLLSLILVMMVGGVALILLRQQTRDIAEQRLREQLENAAITAASLIAHNKDSVVDIEDANQTLQLLSLATHNQLTFSTVVQNSATPRTDTALASFEVTTTIVNDTVVAQAPVYDRPRTHQIGTITASRSTDEISQATARLNGAVALAALIGLIIAVIMTFAATALIARGMRGLVEAARDVVRGNAKRVAPEYDADQDELRDLRDWFNYLAADVERNTVEFTRGQAMLASVLDSMSQGVIALDSNGRVEVLNEQARKILRLNSSQIGERFADFVEIKELIDISQSPKLNECEFDLPHGTRVLARAAPKRDVGGVVLVVEDVTNVRELETIRQDFVANVSHELRTPVAVIRANAETLSAGAKKDPEMAAKLIDGLHRNAERLARILADLLDLSRLDAGHYRLDATAVDVATAVGQAVAAVEPLTKQRNCSIHIEIESGSTVRADAKALDQVLVNLIDNAVKYGASPGAVTVRARTIGRQVRLEVQDDGIGLEPAHQKRVFERFYRADASRSREAGGTGLGLAIVKHLAETMGGQVGVMSARPRGTLFWVKLDVSEAPQSALPTVASSETS